MSVASAPVVFREIPASRAIWPKCFPGGLLERSIFTYAVTSLPSAGEVVAAVLACDSPDTKQAWPGGGNYSAPSLLAFASPASSDAAGGGDWSYRGVIFDARTMVPADTVRGLTAEAAITVLADGETLLAVVRPDGDCTCAMASYGPERQPECGIYRYYYQAYSMDKGATWSTPRPINGTGCVRPHLIALGTGTDTNGSVAQQQISAVK